MPAYNIGTLTHSEWWNEPTPLATLRVSNSTNWTDIGTTEWSDIDFGDDALNELLYGHSRPRVQQAPPEPAFDYAPDMLNESVIHRKVRVKGLHGDDWTGELVLTTSEGGHPLEVITETGERLSILEGDKIALLPTDDSEETPL